MNDKRNNCLTLLKMISCFGVVFIHLTFPGNLGVVIKHTFSFAVPVFIMIAGYYSYGCDETKIKKRLIRTLKIFLFGYFCYFSFYFLVNLMNHRLGIWLSTNYTFETLIKYVIFCKVDFCIPLWYLIAMAETYLLWLFVMKFDRINILKKMTLFFLLLGTMLTIIVDTLDLGWMYKTNFICKALPWFLIGYQMKESWENRLTTIGNFRLLCYATTGLVITLYPILMNTKIDFNDLGVLLTAPSLFIIGVKNPDLKINNFIKYVGDTLSMHIYIFHLLVSKVINSVFETFMNSSIYIMWIYPVAVLLLTILVSHVFEIILNRTNTKHLLR